MKKNISFNVDFDYTLSENLTIHLTANVQLMHSTPHYLISDIHFKNNSGDKPLLDDINIIARKTKKGISWVHADSGKETVLSMTIGKAIEDKNIVETENE